MMKSGNVQRRPDFFISPLKQAFNFPRKSIVFHWHPRQSGGTFGGTNPKSGGTSSMYPHPVGVQLHLTPLGPPRNSPTLRLESPASRLAGKDPSLAGLHNPLWRSQHRLSTKPNPCRGRTQPTDASGLPPERSITEPTRAAPSFPGALLYSSHWLCQRTEDFAQPPPGPPQTHTAQHKPGTNSNAWPVALMALMQKFFGV